MDSAFDRLLRTYAEVILRVGLNLQQGQRLLIAEPFELQGVSREAADLVAAISAAARAAGCRQIEVLWGDEERLRAAAQDWPDEEFDAQLAANTERLRQFVAGGDALLFLESAHPRLMDGLPAKRIAWLRERNWEYYGRVAPALLAGETNWTAAPVPTAGWAAAVFGGCPAEEQLARLWAAVFAACRIDAPDPLAAWQQHLAGLRRLEATLNHQHASRVRFVGAGTDLSVGLSPHHVWCTASLATAGGLSFLPNLPTEEVFTSPDRGSTEGTLRVARPVAYGGATIDGAELEFHRGQVVRARAHSGHELLRRILATDRGARQLGEVALVPQANAIARSGVHFLHPLLDENAMNHVALGDGYDFCVTPAGTGSLNRSLIHLDLPIDASAEFD